MSLTSSRRSFLKSTAAAAVIGPAILSRNSFAQERAEANDRIQIGVIGVGTMGRGHVARFLKQQDVQLVAVCDVVNERTENAREMVEKHYAQQAGASVYRGCQMYGDFRELLASDEIDAVVIATPDHWHATQCILAARAKKDIYCEKPLTHNVAQGRRIVDSVQQNKVVFQTGSQQRSEFGGKFRSAVELILAGRIGKLKTIRVGVGGPPKPCDLPGQEIPEGTDWDFWCGPAVKRDYNEVLCPKGVHKHFPAWRAYSEYGGGGLADMGAHHFDIAQWAMQMDGSGPVGIEPPLGGETSGLKFVYASGVEMFHGGPSGCTFEGTEGSIYVDRNKLETTPAELAATEIPEDDRQVYYSTDHARNWLDCCRSRKDPICTAEIGHRTATICHLGNIGYVLRRPLKWDPAAELFVGDDEANKLLDYEPRDPWRV